MTDIEVICVDDGSYDGSLEIAKEYSSKDSRFSIIKQKNLGAGAARNNGLRHARGMYVHFLDSDDWLVPEAYKIICDKLTSTGVDMCIFQKYLYDNVRETFAPSVKAFEKDNHITNFDNNPSFFIHNAVVPWNKICRRNLIIDNDIWFDEIICANDRSFYFKLILKARKIMVTKDLLLYYRINNSKSLIGTLRSKYYDAHFLAYYSTIGAYENKNNEIKQLVTDACLIDMFRFYDRAHPIYKIRIYSQLHNFFQILDMSHFDNDAAGYSWTGRYRYFRDNKMGFIPLYVKKFGKELISRMNVTDDTVKEDAVIREGVVVSLTSFPERIATVHKTVESILKQTVLPEKIILWLAEDEFPDGVDELPKSLLRLERRGLIIRFCKDLKPHKKYYYAMLEYPDCIIITVDDDVLYDPDVVERLLDSYARFPNAVSGMRVHRITFSNRIIDPYNLWSFLDDTFYRNPSMLAMATGAGGILYPPRILSKELFDEDAIERTCLYGDDLWLKVNQIINGIPTVLAGVNKTLRYIDGTQESSLWLNNKTGGMNDRQLADIDEEINKKYNISPIKILSSAVITHEISTSYIVNCTSLRELDSVLNFRNDMKDEEELIFYNVRDKNLFQKLHEHFFYDSSVMILPNYTQFETPLFFIAGYAYGDYVQDVTADLVPGTEHTFDKCSRNVLTECRIYHLGDSFSRHILEQYANADGKKSPQNILAISPELYTSRSVLALRNMSVDLSGVEIENNDYYSKIIADTVGGKPYGDELTELDIQSVYGHGSFDTIMNLCPICGNLSMFGSYGVKLRDNVLCPTCRSLERHRTAILFLRKIPNMDAHPDILFVKPEKNMVSILRKVGFEVSETENVNNIPGKFNIIIHCHTLKKDKNLEAIIKNTVLKLKDKGIILITTPVKNTAETIHYAQEIGMGAYDFLKLLETYALDVHINWVNDLFDARTIDLYGLNSMDLLFMCKTRH